MRVKAILLAAISAAITATTSGQNTPPVSPLVPAPSVAHIPGVSLRALPAVLDARERRQDWHEAAQQAASRITETSLQAQFNQRISGLVPKIAAALVAQPQDEALVTCAVYREGQGKQAMVTVIFEGLSGQIDSRFFADALSGKLAAPQGQGIRSDLALDPDATSYLVFYMDHRKLDAGNIPQRAMAQSIALAARRQEDTIRRQGALGVAITPPAHQPPSVAQQSDAEPAAAYQPGGLPAYPDVNDGYYYPMIGVPIIIVPGEDANAPGVRDRQRQREQDLERQFRSRTQTSTSQTNHSGSPTAQPASTAVGAGNVPAQGPLTAQQPSQTATQPPNTARQPPNTARQPPNTAKQPPNTAKQPVNTAQQPASTAKPPPEAAKQPPNTASPPPSRPPPANGGQSFSPPPSNGK